MKYTMSDIERISEQIENMANVYITEDGDVYVNMYLTPQFRKADVKKFDKFLGYDMPKEMREFYTEYGGLSLTWQIKYETSMIIEGGAFVRSLDSFMNGQQLKSSRKSKRGERHKEYLWEEGDDPALIKDLEDNYFILDIVEHYSKTFVIFKIVDDIPKLFLYKYPHYMFPLTLGFTDYIEKTIEYRGFYMWQDYFIDTANTSEEGLAFLAQERSDLFHIHMRNIFPEVDISNIPEPEDQDAKYSFEILTAKKEYIQRFEKRFKEFEEFLLTHRASTFSLEYNNDRINIPIIRRIESMLQRPLPDSMLAFFTQINGFELKWKYGKHIDGCTPSGSFRLLGLDQLFGGFNPMDRNWTDTMFEGIVTMKDVMDDETYSFAKECRLLSNEEFNDTVVRFVDGKEEPELYVIINGNFYPMTTSFDDYIELLLENMGLEYWQRYFIDKDHYADEEFNSLPPVTKMLQVINPQSDLSKYRVIS
jgi:hypothetical protein